ncbi:MAG: shikimate kinase [Dehalococcoidia bacterium]
MLAEALGVTRVSLDTVRYGYYREIGYDDAHAQQLRASGGVAAISPYWKPFEAYGVERVLADHRREVIDFGAGHSVYEDPALFERVERALAPVRNVVLLLPSSDRDASGRALRERTGDVVAMLSEAQRHGFWEAAEHFVTHPSNYALATLTV